MGVRTPIRPVDRHGSARYSATPFGICRYCAPAIHGRDRQRRQVPDGRRVCRRDWSDRL